MNQFSHFINVLIGMEPPRTQVTEGELRLLTRHARDASVIVELGCFEGHTANELAASTEGDVYSIDLFPRGRAGVAWGEWIARWGKLRGGSRNLTILRGSTETLAESFDLPIDLLFIDADHSFEGVQRDWRLWLPKVRPGGLIALHDCRQTPNHPRYHGSARFYDEVLKGHPGVKEIDGAESIAVFRKEAQMPPLSLVELQVNAPSGKPLPGKAA